jgi:hypothetical protein
MSDCPELDIFYGELHCAAPDQVFPDEVLLMPLPSPEHWHAAVDLRSIDPGSPQMKYLPPVSPKPKTSALLKHPPTDSARVATRADLKRLFEEAGKFWTPTDNGAQKQCAPVTPQRQNKCRKCGIAGHNKRTCPSQSTSGK